MSAKPFKPQRQRAMLFPCPLCQARPGYACTGKSGIRKAVHKERMVSRTEAEVAIAKNVFGMTCRGRSSAFFQSEEWRMVRYAALKRYGGACQCCGARASKGNAIQVDHIRPRSKFPELALDIENLQVLCQDCNMGKGARDQTDWRAA